MKADHKQEIETTRKGGFGSSDAKMFYKVGLKGLSALNNTDKKRISVAKGLIEYKSVFVNEAMQKGHDFEDWFAEGASPEDFIREKKFTKKLAKNFDTFFHADFSTDELIFELKYVQYPHLAKIDYFEQIQWQIMISGLPVKLIVGDSTKSEFNFSLIEKIYSDIHVIGILEHGIKLIDENWNDLDLTVGEDWTETDLLPFEKQDVIQFTNYLTEIKKLEQEAETRKQKVFQFMQENNIKTLSSEFYSITVVPESTTSTLDKAKLFKEHPEIKETDYIKTSPKKSYLKVTLK